MKKDNWIFALIAVLLLLTLMHGAQAQNVQLKNKYKVNVRMMNGRQFSGILIGASQDSLIIFETKSIVIGCKAKVYLTEDYFLTGEIVGISDSTVVVTTETAANQVIRLPRIKRIMPVSYPKGFDKNALVRTSFPVSQIATIRFAAKGSGGTGFCVGALVGAAVGYGIGYATHSEASFAGPELQAGGFAVLAVPIGGLIGLGAARSGRTYNIDGDPVRYEGFLRKVK